MQPMELLGSAVTPKRSVGVKSRLHSKRHVGRAPLRSSRRPDAPSRTPAADEGDAPMLGTAPPQQRRQILRACLFLLRKWKTRTRDDGGQSRWTLTLYSC